MGIFDLTGKAVLVTGAGKGIGRETALELSALGATLLVTDIDEASANDTAALIRERGGRAHAWQQDVTQQGDWERVVAAIQAEVGRLDVLVNNAGIMLNKLFRMTAFEEYQRVMRINVDSIWLGCQATLPLLTESGKSSRGSSIVNLSSIYGQVAGPMQSAYCASKGAVRMLTKALAVEFARMGTGIRVNSVHPGPINTDLGRSGVTDAVKAGLLPSEAAGMEKVTQQFPMGRWGESDDIASVIAFLASDASKFMTGTELTVDGGYTAI
jgi:NAD(P)-dependent dehydrogenase (short-subunit alcohol dehydrogenase family)